MCARLHSRTAPSDPEGSVARHVRAAFLELLRRLVLRLILLLDGALNARIALLRARLATMPADHRHRARLERELARAARARAFIDDPENWRDPRMVGLAAEVARVMADAGRRAWVRLRWIWGWATRFFRLPRAFAAPCAELEAPEGRCTPDIAAT